MPSINIEGGSSAGTQNGATIKAPPNANLRTVSVSTRPESLREDQADFCPHCQSRFEIVCVKFRFTGAAMIATCPNCAAASAERRGASESINWNFWPGLASGMDGLNQQFKYIVAFLIGAVIIAAVLRHTVHVYGGFSREEIRAGALIAIPAVLLLAISFFRRKHW